MTQIPLWGFLGQNHLETNVLFPSRFCFEHELRAKELSASVKLKIGRQKKKKLKKSRKQSCFSNQYSWQDTIFYLKLLLFS